MNDFEIPVKVKLRKKDGLFLVDGTHRIKLGSNGIVVDDGGVAFCTEFSHLFPALHSMKDSDESFYIVLSNKTLKSKRNYCTVKIEGDVVGGRGVLGVTIKGQHIKESEFGLYQCLVLDYVTKMGLNSLTLTIKKKA